MAKINYDSKYIFSIFPFVYFNKVNNRFLLYNTKNGTYIENDSPLCCQLIEDIYVPENLGVTNLNKIQLENTEIIDFINIVTEKEFGKLIELKPDMPKLINLMPILSLQSDIELLSKNGEVLSDDLLNYINELNIYINNKCDLKCDNCKNYSKQVKSCYATDDYNLLLPTEIKKVLDEASNSSLKRINLLGGNIYLYPYWEELMVILKMYNFEYHYWVNSKNIVDYLLLDSDIKKDILVSFPIEDMSILELLNNFKNSKLHFLVENEFQVEQVEQIFQDYFYDYELIPIYNGENIHFFKNNIFLNKQDIFNTTTSQRIIFCNQKLNSNYFGKLYVLPDGSVKANMNSSILGNVYTNSLLEIVYKELHENTAWRKIRNKKPCNACLYQFLCPAPSNYEISIGKSDLCYVLADN